MMARRVFLSYQHRDHGKAKGFDLMRRSPHVEAEYSVRHLLNPVASTDDAYIGRKIREQQKHTSVTVVLIGKDTHKSDWVRKEVEWSLAKDSPNGIVGIQIERDATIPAALRDYGAEIVDWTRPSDVKTFEDAIERAALRAGRGAAIQGSAAGGASGCGRAA
jgi:hypothetical protein